ncbi:TetR family transcriptional regulator [Deinococcus piscis]|uniref:TetR family transcriptional regulator n=1 Tax=Deinococcus piscis TaxID=394230 RepID=A0ABQ3K1Z0_9DEIO|nr:TetR/AcrR family transcriptional regulator [Deinococcus piscis]GHF97206.1 TetR family transcriptional regulator [Deinococcus piscis]
MTTEATRKPRADVLRNRALILETAQRHFLQHGVNTSLDAIAREASIGPGTLYRHFPTREALLAAVLQTRSEELAQRQTAAEQLEAPLEALQTWLSALEDYLGSFSGLPEPLMAAARASESDNPLTRPCTELIDTTGQFLGAAQQSGHARSDLTGRDLFLGVAAVAWVRGADRTEGTSLAGLRRLMAEGYQQPTRTTGETA